MRAILRAFAMLVICTQAVAGGLADLTDKEAAGGLREALTQGATTAVGLLGKQDGFLSNPKVKIGLPPGLEQAEGLARALGKGPEIDEMIVAMNHAAEAAVPKAKAMLVNAVKQMSVDDARQILAGGDDSVTRYFKEKTSAQLAESFLPVVRQTTDKLQLAQQYDKLAGKAAKYGFIAQEDARVDQYITRKALDGLFLMIGEQERAIRENPMEAMGQLARKAFGAL